MRNIEGQKLKSGRLGVAVIKIFVNNLDAEATIWSQIKCENHLFHLTWDLIDHIL